MPLPEVIELGASIALQYSVTAGPLERRAGRSSKCLRDRPSANCNLASISGVWNPDRSKVFARQFSSKAYFSGEAGGVRLANRGGLFFRLNFVAWSNNNKSPRYGSGAEASSASSSRGRNLRPQRENC